jgi:hypothetical protein
MTADAVMRYQPSLYIFWRFEVHSGASVRVYILGDVQARVVDPHLHEQAILGLRLRKRLRKGVTTFVHRHGEPNGLKPKRVEIKDQKHLWGSCGRDRVVNLNWQLVFGPKTVLEYAVVHELCHLRHRNHDEEFWKLVGSLLPDWESRKAWLDQNEQFLELTRIGIDWDTRLTIRKHLYRLLVSRRLKDMPRPEHGRLRAFDQFLLKATR